LIEQGLTSTPTQYRLYGRQYLYRSKDPTNSIKVLKKDTINEKKTQKMQTTENTAIQ